MRKGFTLIELLVVIAIIAVLAIVVILTLNPGQLMMQARDGNRISDLATLQSAIAYYVTDASINGSVSLGSPYTVYASIPDPSATSSLGSQCQGLGLPALPSGYAYHCASSSTFRMNDGTGWIPVNFKAMSTGGSLGQLPVDAINTSSSRLYYTYTTDGTKYEATASLESTKYKLGGSNDAIANDGGTLATVYERGTKLGLEPLDYGDPSLVGLWTFDEGTGTVAGDSSGYGRSGTITNGTWTTGKIAGAIQFSSTNVSTPDLGVPSNGSATFSAWINITTSANSKGSQNSIFSNFYQHSANNFLYNTGGSDYFNVVPTTNAWHHVAFTWNGNSATSILYLDGVKYGVTVQASASTGFLGNANIGGTVVGNYFSGLIDDVRIYNRALSAAEISALYNGGK
jgi:prepilin-type N-terminal cleavage/methylation domain-containing protein